MHLGAVIGLGIALYFYHRSNKDLKKETSELRRLNELMLRGMEISGWVALNRDSKGKITGYVVQLKTTGRLRPTKSMLDYLLGSGDKPKNIKEVT